jgi:hypothetical protein
MTIMSRLVLVLVACGPGARQEGADASGTDGAGACPRQCSPDSHAVVDCNGNTVTECGAAQACDTSTFTCQLRAGHQLSIGARWEWRPLSPFDDPSLTFENRMETTRLEVNNLLEAVGDLLARLRTKLAG